MPNVKSYFGLKTIVMDKLEALEESMGVALFSGVYGNHTVTPAGYPCVFVIEKTGGGKILDTHRNEREWQFELTIQVQVGSNRTTDEAWDALLQTVDKVIEAFDQDPMLFDEHGQEQCKWVRVVPADFQFGLENGAFHGAVISVGIVDLVNRYAE